MQRTSVAGFVKITTLLLSSVLYVGDVKEIVPKSRVIAVRRDIPFFLGDEGNFEAFPLFTRQLPLPKAEESLRMNTVHAHPFISVKHIRINLVTASSVIQIGSNEKIFAEAREKQFRQLINPTPAGGNRRTSL